MTSLTFISVMALAGNKLARAVVSLTVWGLVLAFIVMVMFRRG